MRLARSAGTIAVDIETAGLGRQMWQLRAVTIGTAHEVHVLDPVAQRAAIIDALSSARVLLFHNSPFDVPVLYVHGLLELEHVSKVHDTIVDVRMIAPSDHGGHDLASSTVRHLGIDYARIKRQAAASWREVTAKPKAQMFELSGLSSEAYCIYAAGDVLVTARLAEVLPAALAAAMADHPFKTSGDWARLQHREQSINRLLLRRSCLGLGCDYAVIDSIRGELMARAAEGDETLASYGIDTELTPAKVKQAAVEALDRLGKLPAKHPRLLDGRPSASAPALAHISHPIVSALQARSQAHGFDTRYLAGVEGHSHNGRVHPQVAVALARTGRMSYGSPPIQQFPPGVRRMLTFDRPAVSMDWSSIEPVYFANVVGEANLIEPFEAGGDVYLPIAELAGVDRHTAKVILLAQLYGQGPTELGRRLGLDTDDARALIDRVMQPLVMIRKGSRALRNLGERHGKVQTMSGRVIPLELDPRTGNHAYLGYRAINYHVQGSCYDLLAEVLYRLELDGLGEHVYAAMHDELVVDSTVSAHVESLMLTPPPALCELAGRVPVLRVGRTELGHHWLDKTA